MAAIQKQAGSTVSRGRGLSYLQEVVTELKKTTWPTNQEATRLTLVVIAVLVALGIYMGALDWGFSVLVSKFSLIK
ncbi:MAG TPA: preprotein translocase subunit SecE [Chthonomonadaceae bacterium]|nr:preprotein translocase subunit SecE [Chthonomonadaceae bacterium]